MRLTTLGGGDGFAVNTNVIMLMGGDVFADECFLNYLKGYQGDTLNAGKKTTRLLKEKESSKHDLLNF